MKHKLTSIIRNIISIDNDLLISKLFYFFFYGAFGSLFPLLSIYFKQLGMNATHAGILVGIRPFVEFFSAPFWGGIADRFKKGKIIFIISVSCWVIFTSVMYFIRPSTSFCLSVYNKTDFVLESPQTHESMEFLNGRPLVKTRLNKFSAPGLSPEILREHHNISGYNVSEHTGLVKSPGSSRVYKRADVERIFFILLILVVISEFFSAPAVTLADTCTLHYLGDSPEGYGKQRMYGPFGWSLSTFAIGMALDYGIFSNTDCDQTDIHERNYTVCFITFDVLMLLALVISVMFRFSYDSEVELKKQKDIILLDLSKNEIKFKNVPPNHPLLTEQEKVTNENKWMTILKMFGTIHYVSFLCVIWWFGFGVGLIFCFLFWHLQDIGGSPSIFGIVSVIDHSSEIVAYFFVTDLIQAIGHIKVLYVGLLMNTARFLYVSWLTDAWLVLPLEVVQGISHAAVWAAATSYIARIAPASYKSSVQGILQGVYYGLGRASGALFGGIIITHFGSETMFRVYGISCAIVLIIFFSINWYLDIESTEIEEILQDTSTCQDKKISTHTLCASTEIALVNAASHYGSIDWTQQVNQRNNRS